MIVIFFESTKFIEMQLCKTLNCHNRNESVTIFEVCVPIRWCLICMHLIVS